jgi:hypothetical protein
MARVSRGPFTTVNSSGSQRASDRFSAENTGSILASLPIQGYSVRLLGRFRTLFEARGKNEDSFRKRFSRDARQRRVDVATRRRGWRSIAHTVSPCGSANRRCVWSTDAARLASSCAVSLQKRALKTARSCDGPDVSPRHRAKISRLRSARHRRIRFQ